MSHVSLSPPAEGGPHMVLVSTDEGVRYAAGDLLETTATQAAKVGGGDGRRWNRSILEEGTLPQLQEIHP